MKPKLSAIVILMLFSFFLLLNNETANAAQNPAETVTVSVPSNPADKANEILSKTKKAVTPNIPEPAKDVADLSEIQKPLAATKNTSAPLPTETTKALEALKEVEKLNRSLQVIKELDKLQVLGTLEIELTNSETYKLLNVTIACILKQDDIDENIDYLEKHRQMFLDTLRTELAVLTDKELGWEQESQNVLKSVLKTVHAVAAKTFIHGMYYTDFELTAKDAGSK